MWVGKAFDLLGFQSIDATTEWLNEVDAIDARFVMCNDGTLLIYAWVLSGSVKPTGNSGEQSAEKSGEHGSTI